MISNPLGFITGYAPSLNLDFTQGVFPAQLSFSRASAGTYFDSAGILQNAALNVPRLDYDPITLQAKGFLSEEQRTNLITTNNTLNFWSQVGGTASQLPGTSIGLNRFSIANSASSGQDWNRIELATTTVTAGTLYSGFFFYETGGTSGRIMFNFRDQTSATESRISGNFSALAVTHTNSGTLTFTDVPIAGSVRKCSFVYTPNFSGPFRLGVGPNSFVSGQSCVVIAAQFEQAAFSTSTIITLGSAVTRSADLCTANVGSWYNPNEGTFFAETHLPPTGSSWGRIIQSGSGSAAILLLGTSPDRTGSANAMGQDMYIIGTVAPIVRHAISYSSTGRTLARQGAFITSSFPSSAFGSTMYIGTSPSGGSALNACIRKLTYWPRRLPNSLLQSLTA